MGDIQRLLILGALSFVAVITAPVTFAQTNNTQHVSRPTPVANPVRPAIAPAPKPGGGINTGTVGHSITTTSNTNAVPTFSPNLGTGGVTTPMMAGPHVGVAPSAAPGRLDFSTVSQPQPKSGPATTPTIAPITQQPTNKLDFSTVSQPQPKPANSSNERPNAIQFSPVAIGTTAATTPTIAPITQQPTNKLDFSTVSQPQPKAASPANTPSNTKQLAPVAIGTTATTTPAVAPVALPAAYTFSPTSSGTIQVFKDDRHISTVTAATAIEQYGYQSALTAGSKTSGASVFATTKSGDSKDKTSLYPNSSNLPYQTTYPGGIQTSATQNPPTHSQSDVKPAGSNVSGGGALTVTKSGGGVGTLYSNSTPAAGQRPSFSSNAIATQTSGTKPGPTGVVHSGSNIVVASVSPAPKSYVGTAAGVPLGTMTLNVPGHGAVTLTSYSNGTNQGTAKGPDQYQCPALVADYTKQLGLKNADMGPNASGTAQRVAATSDGKFTFFGGATAKTPPVPGSVISIAGYPNDPPGHVGIAQSVTQVSATQYKVVLFDQNWPYKDGAEWKTITFNKQGDAWVGTMPNSMAPNKTSVVSGWANPTF